MDVYIEKVHGLQATSVSLNDRFTVLQQTGPRVYRPRRRPTGYMNRLNFRNRQLVEAIARRIEHQAKLRAFRQNLGLASQNFGFRRYGSERSLPGLRRANSFGNLSFRGRSNWGGSNANLSRSASFGNLSWGRPRRNPQLQQRIRNYQGRINRAYQMLYSVRGARGRGRGRGGGRGGGRGRGGLGRQPPQKPVPTREELDQQLDQYMASTKSVLDKQLDDYMNNADITVDMEE